MTSQVEATETISALQVPRPRRPRGPLARHSTAGRQHQPGEDSRLNDSPVRGQTCRCGPVLLASAM